REAASTPSSPCSGLPSSRPGCNSIGTSRKSRAVKSDRRYALQSIDDTTEKLDGPNTSGYRIDAIDAAQLIHANLLCRATHGVASSKVARAPLMNSMRFEFSGQHFRRSL